MSETGPFSRSGVQSQALYFSYEKAGLILDNQPIPWNADAVLVEAQLRLPATGPRTATEFSLRLPGREPIPPETLRREADDDRARLFFHFPPPGLTVTADLLWKRSVLGQVTLPVLQATEFFQKLAIQLPIIHAQIGPHTVACQTFVSSQCKGVLASALLSSPTSLAPLQDFPLTVEFREERGGSPLVVPVHLTSPQLRHRQALVAVQPPKFPRRIGAWQVNWKLEDRVLASQRIKAISRMQFLRSIRLSGTRFVLQDARGQVSLTQKLPSLEEASRLGPCFLVSSRELGMAGLCTLQTRVRITGAIQPPLLSEQEFLVSDGILAIAPGTVPTEDLAQASGFELWLNHKPLGSLLLTPAPTAVFTSEGGFKPPPEFSWSAAAEEQLQAKLSKLLNGDGKK